MTNPKRPESLDRAIRALGIDIKRMKIEEMPFDPRVFVELEDALDVLRAERERRRGGA